jgi:hypothetical protein
VIFGKSKIIAWRRWIILSLAFASMWPGLLAYLDFFLDDRSAYEDDNELTALSLMFSCVPFVLFLVALGIFRRAPRFSAFLTVVFSISVWITCVPGWVDACRLGLGASSKIDVDYLEWGKIGIWVAMLVVCCGLIVFIDLCVLFLTKIAVSVFRHVTAQKSPVP